MGMVRICSLMGLHGNNLSVWIQLLCGANRRCVLLDFVNELNGSPDEE